MLLFVASRERCNFGAGNPPMYVNVNMMTGEMANTWMDALQAAWPSVQVNMQGGQGVSLSDTHRIIFL